MPKVRKDKRSWNVEIIFEKDECPLQYFPDNRIGCMHRHTLSSRYPNDDCIMENCLFIVEGYKGFKLNDTVHKYNSK